MKEFLSNFDLKNKQISRQQKSIKHLKLIEKPCMGHQMKVFWPQKPVCCLWPMLGTLVPYILVADAADMGQYKSTEYTLQYALVL